MIKTILITGANRGIGLALTKLAITKKLRVDACCRDLENSIELKKLSNIYSPYIIKKLPIRISKNGNAGKKTCIMLTKIKKIVTGKINAIKVTNFKFTFPM